MNCTNCDACQVHPTRFPVDPATFMSGADYFSIPIVKAVKAAVAASPVPHLEGGIGSQFAVGTLASSHDKCHKDSDCPPSGLCKVVCAYVPQEEGKDCVCA